MAGLRESLYSQASALATRELVIAPVTHGDQSGVVGCAALAIREVLDSAAVERSLQAGLRTPQDRRVGAGTSSGG